MSDGPAASMATWLRDDPWRFDVAVAIITAGFGILLVIGGPDRFDTGWPEWAAGAGAFGLLLARRWAPLPLLAVALVWIAAHLVTLARPTPMIFAALVLLGTAGVRLERRQAIALGAVVAGSLYLLVFLNTETEFAEARAIISIAWTVGTIGIADAVRSWRTYRESADAQIRSTVLAAEAQAQQQVSEERLAIARELHDLLAHNLSVMNVQTGAAQHLLRSDPDKAEESLTAARAAGRTVLDELSELLSVLRHEEGDDAPTSSLPSVDELTALVDTMRSAGLTVTWSSSGAARPLAPAVSLAAYRIAQEALTNAAKHGHGAAELITEWDDTGLTLRVANDASAEAAQGGGHGVIGMNERATANGGRLSVKSSDGRFVVDAWLPVAASGGIT